MKLKIAFVYIMQIELADIMGGLEQTHTSVEIY